MVQWKKMIRCSMPACFILAIVIAQAGTAEEKASLGTRGLCEYAIQRYNEGYRNDAMHEFKKLLLVDPDNPILRAYLEMPTIEKETEYLKYRLALLNARLSELERIVSQSCEGKPGGSLDMVLCAYAKERYEAGYIEDARHEFSKLLIIDPQNKVAQAFLREPNIKKEIEYLKWRIGSTKDRLHILENMMNMIEQSCGSAGS